MKMSTKPDSRNKLLYYDTIHVLILIVSKVHSSGSTAPLRSRVVVLQLPLRNYSKRLKHVPVKEMRLFVNGETGQSQYVRVGEEGAYTVSKKKEFTEIERESFR